MKHKKRAKMYRATMENLLKTRKRRAEWEQKNK